MTETTTTGTYGELIVGFKGITTYLSSAGIINVHSEHEDGRKLHEELEGGRLVRASMTDADGKESVWRWNNHKGRMVRCTAHEYNWGWDM